MARWLLLFFAVACAPGTPSSAELQAESRSDANAKLRGPLEEAQVTAIQDAARAREAEALALRAVDARAEAERRERAETAAAAWDLRLLDLLAVQLDVTSQIAEAVAARGETPALRAWGRSVVDDTDGWRLEVATLRGQWYGDPRPPRVTAAPELRDLGPVTTWLAERWRKGRGWSRPPAPTSTPDTTDEPFVQVATRSLDRLGGDAVPVSVAEDVLRPLGRRALTIATAGTMQASREELRALSVRVQLGQQRALLGLDALTRDGAGS